MRGHTSARGFHRKGNNNNPYKTMLESMNMKTDRQFLKEWLLKRTTKLSTYDGGLFLTLKGKELQFGSIAEAVYKLRNQYGVK